MRHVWATVGPLLFLLPHMVEAQAPAAPGVSTVRLKSAGVAFDFEPKSGSLAAVDPKAAAVTVYQRAYFDGADPQAAVIIKVGRAPAATAFKRHGDKVFLGVACHGDQSLHIFDATKQQLIKRLRLPQGRPMRIVTSSAVDDPYMYVVASGGGEAYVSRVHLEQLTIERVLSVDSPEVAISADGRLFYGRSAWIGADLQAYRVRWGKSVSGPLDTTPLGLAGADWPGLVTDPFNQYVALGPVLWTADLDHQVKELPFQPMSFFSDRPVILGLGSPEGTGIGNFAQAGDEKSLRLVAASFNSLEVLGQIDLPKDLFAAAAADQHELLPGLPWEDRLHWPAVFADAAGNRALACFGARAAVVPLATLALPDEPLLCVKATAPRVAFTGQKVQIELKPLDPRARVALDGAPEGITLEDGVLVWTPTAEDIGRQVLTLRVSAADNALERLQPLVLEVARRHVRLDFAPQGFDVSPDGHWGVAWITEVNDRQEAVSRVAVVDLVKGRVTHQRRLATNVTVAAVDEQHVYLGSQNSDAFVALAREDLSNKKRLFTGGPVHQFWLEAPGRLYVSSQAGKRIYSLPELKPASEPADVSLGDQDGDALDRRHGDLPPRHLPDGVFFEGILYDQELKSPRLLITVGDVAVLDIQQRWEPGDAWNPLLPWGRAPLNVDARHAHWQQFGQRAVMTENPVAVELETVDLPEHRQLALALRDLLTGARQDSVLLASLWDSNFNLGGQDNYRMFSRGRQIVALAGSRVYLHELPQEQAQIFPVPFSFQLAQQKFVLDAKGRTTLAHKFRGGEPPYVVELDKAMLQWGGVTVDGQTGDVTVDSAALVKPAINAAAVYAVNQSRGRDPDAALVQYVTRAGQQFLRLAGREAEGVPVLVPIALIAHDASEQVARIEYLVFLELPEEPILAELKRFADAREAVAQRHVAQVPEAAQPPALEQRVTNLEKRLDQLEAKIDALTRILSRKIDDSGDDEPSPDQQK